MNLRNYLKVYKKFLHTSLASELEYKTNILVEFPESKFAGKSIRYGKGVK